MTDSCNKPMPSKSWLIRLFESPFFNMSLAFHYLFISKDINVKKYLVLKIYDFPEVEVDFYLPQLVAIYFSDEDNRDLLAPYFMKRSQTSSEFAVRLIWMLGAYSQSSSSGKIGLSENRSHSDSYNMLRFLLLSEQFYSNRTCSIHNKSITPEPYITQNLHSFSSLPNNLLSIDNVSENNFDSVNKEFNSKDNDMKSSDTGNFSRNDCDVSFHEIPVTASNDLHRHKRFGSSVSCIELMKTLANPKKECACYCPMFSTMSSQIKLELEFVRVLLRLTRKLTRFESKDERTTHLQAEIERINRSLPARVWIPVYGSDHCVVRIPPTAAACLNSKEKAPYILCVEAIDDNSATDPSNNIRLHNGSNVGFDSESLFTTNSAEDENSISQENLSDSRVPLSVPSSSSYFSALEIRRRLSLHTSQPQKSFKHDPDDPSASILKEPWKNKIKRIYEGSPFNNLDSWKLFSVIVKSGDDLRQEHLAYQFMQVLQKIWQEEQVELWLRPLKVVVISKASGMIETVVNAVSLHQVKRHSRLSLLEYFHQEFGPTTSDSFITAQRNFVKSCAAYCLFCYFLQVKDRHNGNILLDDEGHVIHIDYGFMLSTSPGKNLGFESSAFKLTQEFVEIITKSNCSEIVQFDNGMFLHFRGLMLQGIVAARKHMDRLIGIIDPMKSVTDMQCFGKSANYQIQALKDRFHMNRTEDQLRKIIDDMISNSIGSFSTRIYDRFQYYSNGILM